jgi:hypothetical protein
MGPVGESNNCNRQINSIGVELLYFPDPRGHQIVKSGEQMFICFLIDYAEGYGKGGD